MMDIEDRFHCYHCRGYYRKARSRWWSNLAVYLRSMKLIVILILMICFRYQSLMKWSMFDFVATIHLYSLNVQEETTKQLDEKKKSINQIDIGIDCYHCFRELKRMRLQIEQCFRYRSPIYRLRYRYSPPLVWFLERSVWMVWWSHVPLEWSVWPLDVVKYVAHPRRTFPLALSMLSRVRVDVRPPLCSKPNWIWSRMMALNFVLRSNSVHKVYSMAMKHLEIRQNVDCSPRLWSAFHLYDVAIETSMDWHCMRNELDWSRWKNSTIQQSKSMRNFFSHTFIFLHSQMKKKEKTKKKFHRKNKTRL